MRAFTNTQVSKEQLLDNIRKHQEAEAFQKGNYWNEEEQTGCGIGCSIHDFQPGMENEHWVYEDLFGIPAELAHLEDSLFEGMDREEDLGRWPKEFISSIPVGADLDRTVGRWLLKVLEHPDSPLVHAHRRQSTRAARDLLRHWVQTGEAQPGLVGDCETALRDFKLVRKEEDHANCIAEQVARYVVFRDWGEGPDDKKSLMLDIICSCVTTSYFDNQGGIPKDDSFSTAQEEAMEILSSLILETLRAEGPGQA